MDIILGWFIFLGLCFFLVTIHEAMHALFMIRYDVRIESIQIGLPVIYTFKWKDIPVKIGLLPLAGGVAPNKYDHDHMNFRDNVIMTASGAVANILFGILIIALLILLKNLGMSFAYPSGLSSCSDDLNGIATSSLRFLQTGGVLGLLYWTSLLSIIIGIGNLIPIPPLDGGRIFFLFLEKFFGPRAKRIGEIIVIIAVVAMIIYTVFILVQAGVSIGNQVITGTPTC